MLDAVVVMDRDGVVRAWNRRSQTIFGWSAAEAMGAISAASSFLLRCARRTIAACAASIGRHRQGSRPASRANRDRSDGSEVPIELS